MYVRLKNLYSKYFSPRPIRQEPEFDLNAELWKRNWEFLFRASELLWARLGDHPIVFPRRAEYFAKRRNKNGPVRSSEFEAGRYGSEFDTICDWIAKHWCRLFDVWVKSPTEFVFEDGFAVLFLIRILWANDTLILRGQYDYRWSLTTSLHRAREKGDDYVDVTLRSSNQFLRDLSKLDTIRLAYPKGIPEKHQQAILQHYGFPTDLLDCTYSYDVALYFAEGGSDYFPDPTQVAKLGAIYAFPTPALPKSAAIITLSPMVMRPSLQRGIFIANMTGEQKVQLERYKFVFEHKIMPIWNGMSNIYFGSPIGLGKYLFPLSDPIEAIARPLTKKSKS